MSRLQQLRAEFKPKLPEVLQNLKTVSFDKGAPTECIADQEQIRAHFPKTFGRPIVEGAAGEERAQKVLRVGVVLSGGQAAGGHNVITGLFDALKTLSSESKLFGFLIRLEGLLERKPRD